MSTTKHDFEDGGTNDSERSDLEIRPMTHADIRGVVRVERQAYSYPWSEGIFKDCLRVGYCCWLAVLNEEVVGYGIMSVGAGESHVLNLCISPAVQNRGYGRDLLTHLLSVGRRHGAKTVMLEVRPTNKGALHLYQSMGFTEVGRRPGYYPAEPKREDALVLAKRI